MHAHLLDAIAISFVMATVSYDIAMSAFHTVHNNNICNYIVILVVPFVLILLFVLLIAGWELLVLFSSG